MDRLLKLKTLLSKDFPNESETVHIFSLIRKEIESISKSEAEKFNYLKLFADWTLHIEISRSHIGFLLVNTIGETLEKMKSSDTDAVIKEISKSLINEFRSQLDNFLSKYSLPRKVIKNSDWLNILQNVLEIIAVHKVIANPDNLRKITLSESKPETWIESVAVKKFSIKKSSNEEIYCLEINLHDTTRIIIPISP